MDLYYKYNIFTLQTKTIKIKNMKKQEVIAMLQNGTALLDVCSIPVTKVIELINQIEVDDSTNILVKYETEQVAENQDVKVKVSKELIEKRLETFLQDVKERIESTLSNFDNTDCVDRHSAEFSINYRNQIELDSIEVDLNDLESHLKDGMEDLFGDFVDDFVDYLLPSEEDKEEANFLGFPSEEDKEEDNFLVVPDAE